MGAVWPIDTVSLSVKIRVDPWLTDVHSGWPRQAARGRALRLNFAASPGRKTRKNSPRWPQRNATLSVGSLLRSVYLRYFSQPAGERALYRAIGARPIRSIVELGVNPLRARRILEVASWRSAGSPLRYTGIDLFDSRPADQSTLTLKQAHAALHIPNVRSQLVPGDPYAALRRVANSLPSTDLLLIAADQDRESLARAWTWVPRMLTATSLLLIEETATKPAQTCWRVLPIAEVQRLAGTANPARRAA